MSTMTNQEKLQEALETVSQAAREQADDLKQMLQDGYEDLRGVFGSAPLRKGARKAGQFARLADEKVKERVWLALGAVAIAAYFAGHSCGRRSY